MAATFAKRACLTGRDIAKLLNGECIQAFGTEFVYDGDGATEVATAADNFKRKAGPSTAPHGDSRVGEVSRSAPRTSSPRPTSAPRR